MNEPEVKTTWRDRIVALLFAGCGAAAITSGGIYGGILGALVGGVVGGVVVVAVLLYVIYLGLTTLPRVDEDEG